jgi:molybdate transport system permease protein
MINIFAREIPTILLSIKISIISTIICFPFAISMGYLLAKKNFFGKAFIEIFLFFPIILPPIATGYILLLFFGVKSPIGIFFANIGIEIPFTFKGAVLSSVVVSFPLFVGQIKTSMLKIDKSLIEAGINHGLTNLNIFKSIVFPLSYGGIINGVLFSFMRSLGEFGATIMIAGNIQNETRTISIAMWNYLQIPYGEKSAMCLLFFSIFLGLFSLIISGFFIEKFKY